MVKRVSIVSNKILRIDFVVVVPSNSIGSSSSSIADVHVDVRIDVYVYGMHWIDIMNIDNETHK